MLFSSTISFARLKTFDLILLYKLVRQLCSIPIQLKDWRIEPWHTDERWHRASQTVYKLYLYLSTTNVWWKCDNVVNTLECVFHRLKNFTKNMSKNNYKQELCHTLVPEKSGHIYQKKEKQLENWQLTLESSAFSNETGK